VSGERAATWSSHHAPDNEDKDNDDNNNSGTTPEAPATPAAAIDVAEAGGD
jgi:hypothetical protein